MFVQVIQCKPRMRFPIVGWLIQAFQKTNYSHYALRFGTTVVDATSKDVRIQSVDYFLSHYEITNRFYLKTAASEADIFNWAVRISNRKYGFLQIVGIAMMVMGIVKKNPFGKGYKDLICNEVIISFITEVMGVSVRDFGFLEDSDSFDLVMTEKLVRLVSVSKDYVC